MKKIILRLIIFFFSANKIKKMEAWIQSIFNNERKRTVNVATEESEWKYENTESTSSDAAKKGPSNVVFITLIVDESHFLDDRKKTAIIAFYFELMK